MDWLVQAIISNLLTSILLVIGYFVLRRTVYSAIDSFGAQLAEEVKEIFSPTVKKGFSLAGSLGGKAKAVGELKNRMAKGFIKKNYGLVQMLAEKFLDIDVEDLIDEYGADTILEAAQSLGGLMKGTGQGFSLGNILKNNSPQGREVPSM